MPQDLDQVKAPKTRGRPKAYDEATAYDAMRGVFWDKGFSATSLDDLSAASGMNRPSLYNAFGDKTQIYRKLLDDYIHKRRVIFSKVLRSKATLREKLTQIYEIVLAFSSPKTTQGRGCFMIGSALTECVRDQVVADLVLSALHELNNGYKLCLLEAKARGEISENANIEALANMASAMQSDLSVRMRAGETPDKLRRYYGFVLDIICGS